MKKVLVVLALVASNISHGFTVRTEYDPPNGKVAASYGMTESETKKRLNSNEEVKFDWKTDLVNTLRIFIESKLHASYVVKKKDKDAEFRIVGRVDEYGDLIFELQKKEGIDWKTVSSDRIKGDPYR